MSLFSRRRIRRGAGPKDIRDVLGDDFTFGSLPNSAASSVSDNSPDTSVLVDDEPPPLPSNEQLRDANNEPVLPGQSSTVDDYANTREESSYITLRRANREAAEALRLQGEKLLRAAEEKETSTVTTSKSGRLFGMTRVVENSPKRDRPLGQKSGRLFGISNVEGSSFSPTPLAARAKSAADAETNKKPTKSGRFSGIVMPSRRVSDNESPYTPIDAEYIVSTPRGPAGTNTALSPRAAESAARRSSLSEWSRSADLFSNRTKPSNSHNNTKRAGLSGKISTGLSGKIATGLSGKIGGRPSRWGRSTRRNQSRHEQRSTDQDVWGANDESDVTEDSGADLEEPSAPENGYGRCKRPDGGEYAGQFVNGEMHGVGSLTFPNGDIYKGEFAHNVRSGMGMTKYADGGKYVGQFANDVMNGHGSMTSIEENGNITKYTGGFCNGEKDGNARVEGPGGSWEWKGVYSDGIRKEGKYYMADGQILDNLS